MIVPLLADGSHIDRLKVPQLTAVLAFKTVEVPKGSIKADLQKLAKDALKLPIGKEPTPLLALPAPPTCNSTVAAGQPGPSSAAMPDEPDDDGGWGEEGASDSDYDTE